LESADLNLALELWRSKCRGGALPSRSDFDPSEMQGYLDKVVLIDVDLKTHRLKYRLIGTLITQVTGRDMTNRYWDEIYQPRHLHILGESLEETLRLRQPVRSAGTMKWVQNDHRSVEILDLPLASDGAAIDMIMRIISFSNIFNNSFHAR
jgi:hypothetical protein